MQIARFMLATALLALGPSLALSQNQQLTNCHTLDSSSNFVGSDEVIVNGMACKTTNAQQQTAVVQPAPALATPHKDSATTNPSIITNARVIELSKLGLDDDIVIAKIRNGNCQFQLGDADLVALKQAGVSAKVIAAMLDTNGPATSAPASPVAAGPATLANAAPASASAADEPAATTYSTGNIPSGARVVIAPMGGFETYFAAAIREKKVPIQLTLNKGNAQYFVVSTETEWQGFVYGSGGSANWGPNGGSAAHGAAASSTRGLEASIMLLDARTKDVVWAYEVHKNSHGGLLLGTHAARGQQSLAEACAKHLKEFIEKGK
jgi:hypothetical protein